MIKIRLTPVKIVAIIATMALILCFVIIRLFGSAGFLGAEQKRDQGQGDIPKRPPLGRGDRRPREERNDPGVFSDALSVGKILLGRPTNHSVTANILSDENMDVWFEYGVASGAYSGHTGTFTVKSDTP
jgi:hypothetical protein